MEKCSGDRVCHASTLSSVHPFIHSSVGQVPVIVAEIGVQSVDIQEQSHGAAQQFREHLCVWHTGWERRAE